MITVFFIILYGLKFGRVKSLCWLTSITIGILQGVVVSTPFKIVLMSAVIATYDSRTVVCVFVIFTDVVLTEFFSRTNL